MSFRQLNVSWDSAKICLPIALWNARARDITKRFGITFTDADHADGLGLFSAAIIEGQERRRFGLIDHLHAPIPGTEICTHEASTDLSADLSLFLVSLGLQKHELIWIHPNAHTTKEA